MPRRRQLEQWGEVAAPTPVENAVSCWSCLGMVAERPSRGWGQFECAVGTTWLMSDSRRAGPKRRSVFNDEHLLLVEARLEPDIFRFRAENTQQLSVVGHQIYSRGAPLGRIFRGGRDLCQRLI